MKRSRSLWLLALLPVAMEWSRLCLDVEVMNLLLLVLADELTPHRIYLSGWEMLGYAVFVCAAGIACCMFTALCLLPTWWKAMRKT